MTSSKKNSGQSLIEILIGLAIGAVLIGTASFAITFMLRSTASNQKYQSASRAAYDLSNKVRAFGEADWQNLYSLSKGSTTQYYVVASGTSLMVAYGREGTADTEVTNGLVGLWKFDETSGTNTHDFSGLGNAGTLISNPPRSTSTCKLGACFAGMDEEYIQANVSGTPVLTSFTLAGWAKLESGQDGTVVGVRAGGAGSVLGGNGSGYPEGKIINNGTTYLTLTGTSTLYDNKWHHLALTLNGSASPRYATLYVDGKITGSSTVSSAITGSTDYIRIGKDTGVAWDNWDGDLDDVRIYSRSLSPEEILRLFNVSALNRYFSIENVCRSNDSSSTITSADPCAGGSIDDPSTQRVIVYVEWMTGTQTTKISVSNYLTRWENMTFWQTDWSDGSGLDGPFTSPRAGYSSGSSIYINSSGSIRIQGL